MRLFLKTVILTLILNSSLKTFNFDVSVLGYCLYADGLGRLPIGFMENFKDDLKINFLSTRDIGVKTRENFSKISPDLIKIIQDQDKSPGKVSILFDALWYNDNKKFPEIPNSIIKIAYSMFESTKIPDQWVEFLNKNFDSVAVPSEFLIKVYKDSGVKLPIFLMPHGIYIEDFLNQPIKSKKNNPFVFGCFGTFCPHKNQELVLKAFLAKFKDNQEVILKFYGVGDVTLNKIYEIIDKNQAKNVHVINKFLSPEEYLEAFKSIDCCITLSKSEGYSVRPREAAALGIPTILSNNTAHKSLCKLPYFISVKSDIPAPADYTFIFGDYYGFNFDCKQSDVEKALEKAYLNFDYYLKNAEKLRDWSRQFEYRALSKKYLNLVKPKKVILGSENLITDQYLMTDSKELYEKYLVVKSLN